MGAGEWPVAGVDEAGRGPLAGPVVAAAVVLDLEALPEGIDDSKKLDEKAREQLFEAIVDSGARIGVGIADVSRIDAMNILRATMWAMSEAVAKLEIAPRLVLVDGNRLPALACRGRTIVGGDATCLSIAAASIVAKVTRDRIMVELARQYPGYGFDRHKGYGTPEHLAALGRLGPSHHHRMSFKPVRAACDQVS
jgi:ribonuclease HII